ncbi:MAG: hypothetical protein ACD_10C00570G0002 [uncultured bacterium]|nr:MAG: hypothetical protein ACD_10C00570G0002 [uncultured bacterium]
MGAAAGPGALKAMGFEFKSQTGDAGDMGFNVAGAIFAARSGNADQVGKVNAIVNAGLGQVQHLEKAFVPDAQTQTFIKNTNPLRHAGHDGLQVSVFAFGFSSVRWRCVQGEKVSGGQITERQIIA